ncbi:DUF3320 domain-containing protein [Stenotrophomonas sp. GZD-301]|uniref:DUF3320 domain-containing protein n=1 Tax=Stenotrophomonas sp. GZD-301 TaxID=3404814 RepID=UPI003BB5C5D0
MSIRETLQAQRRVLLDLTYRNRLLNLPKKPSSRSLVFHDERAVPTLQTLLDRKAMTFAAVSGDADVEGMPETEAAVEADLPTLPQPGDEPADPATLAAHHTDSRLQTRLKSEHLQKRLLDMYYEYRTMLEEQGVNVLYLALGQLAFREPSAPADEVRHAPLVLLPVVLERKSARDRFALRWAEEDPQENLSLREKLRVDFGIVLPPFPEADAFDLAAYLDAVRACVAAQPGWSVLDNALQLGFFSFSKLLMFLDLDPEKWPEGNQIDQNRLVQGLLGEGFDSRDSGLPAEGPGFLDALIPAADLKHVMDCDSSQALAIEAVRRGQDLVIQGPPGTGKSQTIANLIATAVGDGRKVLFVSEKMAALEVVKRRLENVGLGPLCLELHSNKANKRSVLEELGRTLQIGRPEAADVAGGVARLDALRGQLNDHAQRMHAPVGNAGMTPFRILGELIRGLPRAGRPPYRIDDAGAWSRADLDQRIAVLREVCAVLPRVGDPQAHVWRGVTHGPVLRTQAEDLVAASAPLAAAIQAAVDAADGLGAALGVPAAVDLHTLEQHCQVADMLAAAPAFDRSTIASGVWTAGLESLRDALQQGQVLTRVRAARVDQVIDMAWSADWVPQRLAIAAHGDRLLRIFNGSYRQAIAQLRSVMKGPLPKGTAARLALLDDLIAARTAQAALTAIAPTATAAFGSVWQGTATDWTLAESILGWVQHSPPVGGLDARALAAVLHDRQVLVSATAPARAAVSSVPAHWDAFATQLQIDTEQAVAAPRVALATLTLLQRKSAAWTVDVDGLLAWLAYAEAARRADALGLQAPLALAVAQGHTPDQAEALYRCAFHLAMLTLATTTDPALAVFDGRQHETLVAQFRQWDRMRLSLAQVEAAQAHHAGLPRGGVEGIGALGTLRSEIARKRNHMALRRLFRLCASPIQTIKPVFMMSPLSVAQFLEPGAIDFDLLVIDEASQVEPVDALGAIARCRQIVVVGDDKQLPPTSFFARLGGAEDDPVDEEGAQARDLESVLSLCAAKGLPQRMLQWHYRSRHESLIAVSNKTFYEGKLFIVPSPDRERSQSGLRLRYLPDGRFDRGNTYKNDVEAVAIAQAVVEHARHSPQLTLGVGAMSVRQRQAISDALELARRQHPELEAFIARHPHEPFFVKNLENIQGDERDVILISIGYGRAKGDGKLYQGFGPLNADGGHRRLNVLITRARQRCEVFSSITADDIRVDERTRLGVVALKAFLQYAEKGDLGVPQPTGRGVDSPFEAAVQEALAAQGFQVDSQVGVAGFFIDLAVVDPDAAGRYLLGIECDGAAYHAAPSARDRDRLRQEILENHGWSIHRIWSTDWFQRPEAELERLLAALAAARQRQAGDAAASAAVAIEAAASVPVPAVQRRIEETALHAATDDVGTLAYVQADFAPAHAALAPHDVPLSSMAATVEHIVDIEGPIHEDEIIARVRDLWNLQRAGSRIQAAVQAALAHAGRDGALAVEDGCYLRDGRAVVVRNRMTATSRSLRRPEMLPPQEIRQALLEVIESAHGAGADEVAVPVARRLGFQALSQPLRERIAAQVQVLLDHGRLEARNGALCVTAPAP